jgi:hydroxyacylglutathione hydrolase
MRRVREIAPGVLVATAELLTCTTTVVVGNDGGCLVIDPAVSVPDLSALAADLADAGLRPVAGFATHPHWDHVLWSRQLGDVPRYAAADCVRIMRDERTTHAAELDRTAPGHDMELFGRLVALPTGATGATGATAVPWDGPDVEVLVHNGHSPGHCALFVRRAGVLVAGDMLSDIEIPLLDTVEPDPLGDYLTGLALLAAVPGVRWLVPGHGHVGDAAEFRRRVEADYLYLAQLAAGEPFDDPRATVEWQQNAHAEQLQVVAGRARQGSE